MASVWEDTYGHRIPAAAPALAAAAVSTSVAGTIVGTTSAGAAPTVTGVSANDTRGTYVLNPVTGGGAQAAGATSTVFFTNPYGVAPSTILVNVIDSTVAATPVWMGGYATGITASQFSVTTPVLTTAHNYTVTYQIIP
jgi:hypothetical protein